MFILKYDHLGTVSTAEHDALNWAGLVSYDVRKVSAEWKTPISFRCHSIARALLEAAELVGNPYGIALVDGAMYSRQAGTSFVRTVHSWNTLPSGAILDLYPPAMAFGAVLLPKPNTEVTMGRVFYDCYAPNDFSEGQREYLASPALALESERLGIFFREAARRVAAQAAKAAS
jgi:hypothetical protein